MGKNQDERKNTLKVARVGAMLVDFETGTALGAHLSYVSTEPSESDDAGVTDLPTLVLNPRGKPNRSQ